MTKDEFEFGVTLDGEEAIKLLQFAKEKGFTVNKILQIALRTYWLEDSHFKQGHLKQWLNGDTGVILVQTRKLECESYQEFYE